MPAPSPARSLQDLLDRAAISDVLLNYTTGIDRQDWALYRSVFADTVDIDFAGWAVEPAMQADGWVADVRETLSGFDATQHNITNHVITLNGDEAEIVAHMVARHVFEGEIQTIGGFYTDRLIRRHACWTIIAVTLTTTWMLGDMRLFDRAKARGLRPE